MESLSTSNVANASLSTRKFGHVFVERRHGSSQRIAISLAPSPSKSKKAKGFPIETRIRKRLRRAMNLQKNGVAVVVGQPIGRAGVAPVVVAEVVLSQSSQPSTPSFSTSTKTIQCDSPAIVFAVGPLTSLRDECLQIGAAVAIVVGPLDVDVESRCRRRRRRSCRSASRRPT